MKLRAAIAVLAAVTLAQVACDSGGAALVAVIQLEPGVRATCVTLTVTEPGTSRLLGETHAVKDPGRDEYRFAVYRRGSSVSFPAEVVLQAHALSGPNGCAAGAAEVSSSETAQRTFPSGLEVEVPLFVPRPPSAPDTLQLQAVSPVLHAGDCVNTAVRTTLGGVATPVLASTPVDLSVEPDAGLSVFTDGTCTSPVSGATLPAGSAVLPVQLRGLAAGSYTVTASAQGMDSGMAALSVVLTQATAIDFSSPAVTALSGACLGPVRLRAEDASGNPSLLDAGATIGLSSVAGVTFFSDAACSGGLASVVLGAGQPEASFWFRSRATGAVALHASAGALGNPTQTEQIVPNVRTGSCTLDAGTAALACPVGSPGVFDLSKAFLVVQAISNDDNPNGVNVRCRLADAGTIDCSRAGTTGWVDVGWQLVELPAGIRVQRVDNTQCAGTNLITLPQAVDPAQTFLLFTAEGSGNIVDANDYRTVRLVSGTQVEVLNNADCDNGTLDVQVIEMQGAFVERGVLDAGVVPSVTVTTGTAVDTTRSFLLHSARFTGGSGLCGFQLRGELTSANTITFTRGNGDNVSCQGQDITALAWERVELPAGASSQQVIVSMADGAGTASSSITPVDPAHAFAFASSNFNAGQGFGETNFNADDLPGVVGARLGLATGSRLEAARAVDAGNAQWTSYVVELP